MRKRQQKARLLVEELEPRILHSADAAAFLGAPPPSQLVEIRIVDAPSSAAQSHVETPREIVFVDSAVDGYRQLVDDIAARRDADLAVYVLDAGSDGVAQIGAILAGHSDIAAIHLISHGSEGSLALGSAALDRAALERDPDALAAWGAALMFDADLLIYGCDVAAGAEGEAFVDTLARLTGADVAASADITGSAAKGGDWDLEYASGDIGARAFAPAAMGAWDGTLAIGNDAASSAATLGTDTTLTFAHTVGQGNDRLLVVEIAIAANQSVSSVTYGGAALVQLAAIGSPGDQSRAELWYLVAPGSGTANVVVTLNGSEKFVAGATSFSGVDQATPFGTVDTAAGTGGTPSVTIASAAGEKVIDVVALQDRDSGAPDVGQSTLWTDTNGSAGADAWGGSSVEAGAPSVTMSWSTLGDGGGEWAAAAAAIRATNVAPTVADRALVFDGTDAVVIADSPSLNMSSTMTMEATFKSTGPLGPGNQIVLNKEGEYELGVSPTGGLIWAFASTTPGWSWVDTGYTVPADTWIHVAVTYDTGVVNTYVDGQLIHTYTGTGAIGDVHPADELMFGARANAADQHFIGMIDEVRLWNVERTAAQIRASYSTQLAGNEAGLAGYWTFDEPSGTTVLDRTANDNDGVLGGGVAANVPARTTNLDYAVSEDSPLNITAPGVLRYASDAEGSAMTAVLVTGPANASAFTLNADGSFTYTATVNYTGSDSFVFKANDGTSDSEPVTVRLTVTAVNDAPSGANKTVGTNEDTAYTFSAADFGFSDAADGNALSGVKIVALPAAGTLALSGVAVTAGQTIAAGSIGNLTFTPAANANGAAYASFTFQVQDDGGVANGGVDTDATVRTLTIDVAAVNDAPVLSGTNDMATINRNAVSNRGTLVADLLAGHVTDVDAAAVYGIAVTGVVNTNGSWQYSTNGGSTWSAFGAASAASARLLAADIATFVRFVPTADYNGTVTNGLTFQAWDTTSGVAGGTANATVGGAASAFSADPASASIIVSASNTAPTLSGSNNLTAIDEDAAANGGTLVSALIATFMSDVDPGAVSGIAVTAVNNANGTWQYTVNGGTSWTSFVAPSATAARLLAADTDTSVRFVPNADWNGTIAGGITFRAWDRTTGVAGATADTSGTSGTFADNFGSNTYSNNDGNLAWNGSWVENDSSGGGAAAGRFSIGGGRLHVQVASAGDHLYRAADLSGASTATLSFTYQSGLGGAARIDVQASSNGGATYTTLGGGSFSVSNAGIGSSSLSLAGYLSADTRIRFLVVTGETGAGNNAFSIDHLQLEATAANGGSTAFSAATAAADVTVNAVNDIPARSAGAVNNLTVAEDAASTSLGLGTLAYGAGGGSDENVQTFTYTVTAVPAPALGTVVLADGTTAVSAGATYTLAELRGMRFTPAANASGGPATFSWSVADSGGTANGGADTLSESLTISVTAVNDAPVLSGANNLGTINRNPVSNAGTLVADLIASRVSDNDSGAVYGVAVTGVDNSNGAWQYSTDSGASWSAFGTPGTTTARLLAADVGTYVRFVPNAGYSGTVTNGLTFSAWDQTSGVAGATADVTVAGAATAFSAASASASITVTATNTAPVLTGANDLVAIAEDATGNAGTPVSALIASMTSDADPAAMTGIAVTAVDNTRGTWQYSVNAGSTWTSFGTPSASLARLLAADANTYVRFVPNADWNGTVSNGITFRAWDRTSGANGGTADTSGLAGTFRDDFASASYANSDGSLSWTGPWVESDSQGGAAAGGRFHVTSGALAMQAGNVGDNIYREANLAGADAATLSFSYWSSLKGAAALQIQVSSNGGASYTTIAGGVFDVSTNTFAGTRSFDITSSIASNTRVRWMVVGGEGAAESNSFYVGNMQITASAKNGGTTAFSTATASAGVTVNPVNDAPVRTAGAVSNLTVLEDAGVTSLGLGSVAYSTGGGADESGQTLSVTVTAVPSAALGSVVLADGTTAVAASTTYSLAQLQGMQFKAAPNADGGPATFSWSVADNGGTTGGGVDTLAQSLTVTVTAVNDAPAGADRTITVLEDAVHTFAASDFGFVDASDSPANALAAVRIVALPGAGSLTLAGVAVTAGQSIAAADIAAGSLKFSPLANANGAAYASFTFRVQDDGGTANGGVDLAAAPRTITFDVTPVNDAPAGANKTITMLEDAVYTFVESDFGFVDASDSPAHALAAVRVVALPGAGSLTLSGVAMTAGQSIATADIAAGRLKFAPAPNANGAGYASFTFRVQDDGGTADSGVDLAGTARTITVDVTSVNDAPSGANKTVTALEDTAYTFVAADFGFGDAADPNALLEVRIVTLPASGSLTIAGAAVSAGQSISAASIAAGDLRFTPGADANGAAYASFTFRVRDDGGVASGGVDLDTLARTMTIDVAAVNDAPSGADKTVTTPEDTTYTFSVADFGFSDAVDSNALLDVRIASLPAPGTLTLSGVAVSGGQSIAAARIAAGDLRYTPAADGNGASYASFTFQVRDDGGIAGGGIDLDPTLRTMTVDVTPVNDAPTGADRTVTVLEDGAHTFAVTDFGFGDADGDALTHVRIASLPLSGSLTLSGVAIAANQLVTVASIGAGELRFTPAPDANGAAYATFTFQVRDDGGAAAGGVDFDPIARTMTIAVTAVNDAPSGTSTNVATLEDTPYTFALADFGYADTIDAGANALAAVRISALPAVGALIYDFVPVTAGQIVSAADIAAGKLMYMPALDGSGAAYASFAFEVQDDGGTANGGTDFDPVSRTMSIAVTAVNDAPTGSDHTVTTLEDTAYAFSASDFGFGDALDGDAFLGVRIASLPAAGTLTLAGAAVAANQFVSLASIAGGDLVYTPAPDANGGASGSFTFRVQDDGGTADGGVDLDGIARTMTVAVTPVNDAPSGASTAVTTLEDTEYRFTVADFGFGDARDGNAFSALRIVAAPGAGTLTLGGAAVGAGQVVSVASIAAGDLRYTPGANRHGAAHASFTFQVRDDGGVANGGIDADAAARTMTIDVLAVNDAPTGTSATATINEGVAYIFGVSSFGFADASDAPANALSSVRVVALAGSGAFTLGGVAVVAGDMISASRIAAGELQYAPGSSGSGAGYASIEFQVQDDGGTASGGADTDGASRTLTIDVRRKPDPAPADPVIVVTTPPPASPAPVEENAAEPAPAETRAKVTLARIAAEIDAAAARALRLPVVDASGEVLPPPVRVDSRSDGVASITQSSSGARRDGGQAAAVVAVPIVLDVRAEGVATVLPTAFSGRPGAAGVAGADVVDSSADESDVRKQAYALLTMENGVRASAIIVSAGMVTWTLHGAGLIASLLTSAPAWRHLDPLPVLAPETEKPDWGENDGDAQREEDAADRLWLGSSSGAAKPL